MMKMIQMALRRICGTGLRRACGMAIPTAPAAAMTVAPPVLMAAQMQYRAFSKKAKNKSAPAASHSGEHHHHAPATGGADAAVVDMKALKSKMERSLQILEKDFAGIRGGKADPAMFDHLHVKAYGQSTPLGEVAQVTIKSPTMAIINVYDTELLEAVNTAIKESKLDLMPRVDGNAVTVPLPKPSAEQRESMVKLAHQHTEKAKQHIRKVRRDGLDKLKNAKDSVGEDEIRRQTKNIETLTEELVKKASEVFEKKKKDIITV